MDRNLVVDYAKVAMALMVVAIHTSLFSAAPGPVNQLLTEGVFRIAVPIFFIFNGYYLGPSVHNRGATFKLIKRLLLLHGCWMIVYASFYARIDPERVKLVLFGYFHLWYLIGLVHAVALLWLTRKLGPARQIMLGLAVFAVAAVLQYLTAYTDRHFAVWQYRNGILFGFPFVMAGYLLRSLEDRVSTRAAWLILAAGMCALAAESLFAWHHARPGLGFDVYPSLMLAAPAAALLLLRSSRQLRTDRAAKLSTHLYLIHPWMIKLAVTWLAVPRGGGWLFGAAVLLSLLTFPPLYYLSRKIRFIL